MLLVPVGCALALGPHRIPQLATMVALIGFYLAAAATVHHYQVRGARRQHTDRLPTPTMRWIGRYITVALTAIAWPVARTPVLIGFGAIAATLLALQIALARRGSDRTFGGALLSIVALTFGGPTTLVAGGIRWSNANVWALWTLSTAFFVGSMIFVRSLIRARRDRRYATAAVLYPLVVGALLLRWHQPLLASIFAVQATRALVLWQHPLRPAWLGLLEGTLSILFGALWGVTVASSV